MSEKRKPNGQFGRIDLTGRRFGRWLVLRSSDTLLSGKQEWLCQCDCGNSATVRSAHLRSDKSTSCGCYIKAKLKAGIGTTHGMTHTRTYNTWRSMIQRCLYPDDPTYLHYGALGITICERWLTFQNFLADMGLRPEGKTLDRYPDRAGNYELSNCRWATYKEQSNNTKRNRILTWNGIQMTARELSDIEGIPFGALRGRVFRKGQDVNDAVRALKAKGGLL